VTLAARNRTLAKDRTDSGGPLAISSTPDTTTLKRLAMVVSGFWKIPRAVAEMNQMVNPMISPAARPPPS